MTDYYYVGFIVLCICLVGLCDCDCLSPALMWALLLSFTRDHVMSPVVHHLTAIRIFIKMTHNCSLYSVFFGSVESLNDHWLRRDRFLSGLWVAYKVIGL